MSDAPAQKSVGVLDKPITNTNHVPAQIRAMRAAKQAGAFTFQAGRFVR
jgi:hypothetical protein